MTDIEIIEGFLNNDKKVIANFYREFRSFFCNFFRTKFLKDDEYLNDLYQDVCIILWDNIQTKKLAIDNLTSKLSTYLIGVGENVLKARDRKYKEDLSVNAIKMLDFVTDEIDELNAELERNRLIHKMVSGMKPPCSYLLKAYYWDKLSCSDIAIKFKFSNADSVKSQKFKCMRKLKNILEPYRKNN